jgi:hypothetical protein
LTVDVLFPSWGRGAQIEAVFGNGARVVLAGKGAGSGRPDARRRRTSTSQARRSGYVVVPRGASAGTAHMLRPEAPVLCTQPGPTLAIQIVRHARFGEPA